MDPGQDCLSCHSASGVASAFTVGGTVFPLATATADGGTAGVEIDLVDSNGKTLALHSNAAGNFYSTEALAFPAQVSVTVGGTQFAMQQKPPSGACNSCHALKENPGGTFQTAPIPPSVTGFLRPPGHLYAFASDGGCASPAAACPASPPSYQNQVQSIVEGSCLACHVAGQDGSAWLLETPAEIVAVGVSSNALQVAGCKMPPANSALMSPEEEGLLLSWLACGAPSN